MRVIAVIPTRKGSSRIKNKNTRSFNNSNLLKITIQKLLKVQGLYKIIVSSNDEYAKEICDEFKTVLFCQRDEKYCTNKSSATEWNCELAKTVLQNGGTHMLFTHCICPFMNVSTYQLILDLSLKDEIHDSFLTCSKLQKHIWTNTNGVWQSHNYKNETFIPRSQDLSPIYVPTWGAVICKCDTVVETKSMIGKNPYFLSLNQLESFDLDTNVDFLIADTIASMGFSDISEIDKYMNNKVNASTTQLLDRTIRDGGYTNNWEFDDEFVKDTYHLSSKMGVDYFEIGFRNNQCSNRGKYYNLSDDNILQLQLDSGPKLALMVTVGRFETSNFVNRRDSPVHLVRVLIHRENGTYNLKEATNICLELYDKGYEVTLNIANCESLNEKDIQHIKEVYRTTLVGKLKCIYLADTFGNCRPKQITLFKILFEETPLGFHSHDNSNNSNANTMQAMDENYTAVDACITGLGKNCGNTKTEFIAYYKLHSFTYVSHYVEYVLKYYEDKYDNYLTLLAYYVSGTKCIHSDYINFLKDEFKDDTWNMFFTKLLVVIDHLKTIGAKTSNSSSDRTLIKTLFN